MMLFSYWYFWLKNWHFSTNSCKWYIVSLTVLFYGKIYRLCDAFRFFFASIIVTLKNVRVFKTIKTINELKQFCFKPFKKKQFFGMFGIFLKCIIDCRESKTQFMQKWCLALLWYTGPRLNFDKIWTH